MYLRFKRHPSFINVVCFIKILLFSFLPRNINLLMSQFITNLLGIDDFYEALTKGTLTRYKRGLILCTEDNLLSPFNIEFSLIILQFTAMFVFTT